jgi:predicted DNA-binding transcriptional regulator AlpA
MPDPTKLLGVPEAAGQELMTTEELAQQLSVSQAWIRDHASGRRRPVPPSINLGTKQHPNYRFDRKAVQEWLNQLAKKS